MNLSDVGIVFAMSSSLIAGAGAAGNYYLENEYISAGALQQYELRGLKRDARKLKRMIDGGELEYQDDYLDLLDEIEDIESEIQ